LFKGFNSLFQRLWGRATRKPPVATIARRGPTSAGWTGRL